MPTVFENKNKDRNKKRIEKKQDKDLGKNLKSDHHLPMPESVRHEKPTTKKLSAYMVKPNNLHFETQDRKEKIVVLLRKHMITNSGWFVGAIFLVLMPIIFAFIPWQELVPLRFKILFYVMWYMFVATFVFENFLSWYFNVYIITDERIVDVDFHSLLHKKISQAKIDNIEDVTFTMGGLSRTMFNYGTVEIQTAAEKREFDFEDVPHPNKVAKILNELILEEEKEKIEGRVR